MAASIRYSGFPILDDDGLLSSGALVYVYDAGTTTKRDIFTDSALSTAADNPIICTGGYCPQRYTGSGSYKLVVTTAAGASLSHLNLDNIDTGVAVGSGDLPVADGGTAASTAADARTNLGAASSVTVSGLSTDVSTLQTRVGTTDATTVAVGTTAQEPAAGAGKVRYDSTTGRFRASNGSAFQNLLRSTEVVPTDFAASSSYHCLQRVRVTSTATTAITATIAADTSIPQITEGTQILTTSFTPRSASSELLLRARVCGTFPTGQDMLLAVFRSTSNDAIVADFCRFSAVDGFMIIEGTYSPGSTNAITLSARVAVTGGTFTLNHTSSNNLGGVVPTFLQIEEWLSI